jgi:hypothetical protein
MEGTTLVHVNGGRLSVGRLRDVDETVDRLIARLADRREGRFRDVARRAFGDDVYAQLVQLARDSETGRGGSRLT